MVIQSRRRVKKNGRRSLVLFMALLSIAAIVGGAVLYRQEIKGFASNMFSGLDKTANAKKKVRGTIYDRNFKELAVTLDRVSVYVRPRELGDVRGNAGQLANVLGMNEQELLERLDTESQRVWLAKDISQEEEQAVADLHLSGVFLNREQVRYYPQKSVAAHVIGFADQTMGLAGAEHYYNRLLDQPSINHKDFPHVDFGDKLSTGTSGQHLVLTIDLKIQDLLEKYVATLGAAHAGMEIAALLMETGTGAIVANANFPSFDPNIFYQYKNESFNNVLFAPVVIPPVIQGFFQDAALIQAGVDRYDQVYPWSISAGAADFGAGYRSGGLTELSVVPELDFSLQDGNGNIAMSASGSKKNPAVSAGATGDIPLKATPIQILLAMNNLLGSNSNGEHRVSPHVLDRVLERNGECEYPYRLLTTGDGKRRFDVSSAKVSLGATAEQGGPSVEGARDEAGATAEQGGSSVEGARDEAGATAEQGGSSVEGARNGAEATTESGDRRRQKAQSTAEMWRLIKAQGAKGVLDSVILEGQNLPFQPLDAGHGRPSVAGSKDGAGATAGQGGPSAAGAKDSEYRRTRMMFALLPGEKPELILMVVARQPYLDPVLATAKYGLDLTSPIVKVLPAMVALQQVHKHLSDMRSVVARKESNYQQANRKINLSGAETMIDQQHMVMPDLAGMSLRRALCLLQEKKIKVQIQGTGRVVSQVPAAGMSLDKVKECRVTLKKDEKAVSEISKVSAKKQVQTEVIKKISK